MNGYTSITDYGNTTLVDNPFYTDSSNVPVVTSNHATTTQAPYATGFLNILKNWGNSLWNNNTLNPQGLNPHTGSSSNVSGMADVPKAWADMGFMDKANTVYGGVKAAYDLWNSWQSQKRAEQQFKLQKQMYEDQWNTQRKTVNTALEDRQRARVASNANAYESVDSYMKKNGV